jgi:hypothetical protein
MQKLIVSSNPNREHHVCTGSRQGDWVVHACPDCDFELWDNLKTGELEIYNDHNISIEHSGFYIMPEYLNALNNRN